MEVVVLSGAEADLDEIYHQIGESAGERLLLTLDRKLELLRTFPRLAPSASSSQGSSCKDRPHSIRFVLHHRRPPANGCRGAGFAEGSKRPRQDHSCQIVIDSLTPGCLERGQLLKPAMWQLSRGKGKGVRQEWRLLKATLRGKPRRGADKNLCNSRLFGGGVNS
jgi:plasmid stabilization system protein ParE